MKILGIVIHLILLQAEIVSHVSKAAIDQAMQVQKTDASFSLLVIVVALVVVGLLAVIWLQHQHYTKKSAKPEAEIEDLEEEVEELKSSVLELKTELKFIKEYRLKQ